MTADRTPAHLADMLQFVQELRSITQASLTAENFAQQRILCLAVEKLFINLGEAASRVDPQRAQQMTGGTRSTVQNHHRRLACA